MITAMSETQLQKRVREANANLAAGGFLRNPRTSPFNTLALTCMKCGAVVSTPLRQIRRTADHPRAAKCPCYSRRSAAGQQRRAREDPEYRAALTRQLGRRANRVNAESRDNAWRHGQPWTGPELEIAARRELTASQVAKLTGRTVRAVRTVRTELERDPRRITMAGTPRN